VTSNLKIQIEPKTAEVYVDGHLAGMVDDFDGVFQSLPVEVGGHEIAVYKPGYQTFTERLYCRPGNTYRIRETLRPLPPGQADDPRPAPALETADEQPVDPALPRMSRPSQREPIEREPADAQPGALERQAQIEPGMSAVGNFGQVAIRVQPADAEVLIDDEVWRGPQGAERLVVYLKPGPHRIEIRKEGFDPFVTSVEIKKGQTAVLNVSLGKTPGI